MVTAVIIWGIIAFIVIASIAIRIVAHLSAGIRRRQEHRTRLLEDIHAVMMAERRERLGR